jgi:hypothetical protein
MKNLAIIIALTLVASAGYSQKGNLSGEWKINWGESQLWEQFSLAADSMTVIHKRKTVELERIYDFQGAVSTTKDLLTLDGKVCENRGWRGAVKKSTAVWDKKTKVLTISSKMQMNRGGDVEILEEFLISGDNLILESSVSSERGEMVERFVFERQ